MPIRRQTLETTFVRYHSTASNFLAACQNDLLNRERDANIILPFALKSKFTESPSSPTTNNTTPHNVRRNSVMKLPRSTFDSSSDTDPDSDTDLPLASSPSTKDEQFWLSAWTTSRRTAKLDLVLSCTTGPIGKYPIFLYANVPDDDLTPEWVVPRVELLVKQLRSCTSTKRVFSVFGPVPLTRAFVSAWSFATPHLPIPTPYYAAKHTFCTRSTLTTDPTPLPPSHTLKLADESDLARAAELCFGFAAGSEPFVLSPEDAVREARGYIALRQMYVYNITDEHSARTEAASIVCVTRSSAGVAAITKVYTNPLHRGKRCAERLVRFVVDRLLVGGTEGGRKEAVVLFVAHDNAAAEKVYDRVGFQGLCGKPRPEGVNDWVEIGFEGTELGHW